jgi:uncharacterized membrane protein YciS (DUF1049 family)
MIGALIVIAGILGAIAVTLFHIRRHLSDILLTLKIINERIADVTTTAKDFLGRDILVIRTKADS